jgi:hypothetical protein
VIQFLTVLSVLHIIVCVAAAAKYRSLARWAVFGFMLSLAWLISLAFR